jgi:hypothetical protein
MLGKGKGALLVALLGKKPEAEVEEKQAEESSSGEVDGVEYDEALKSSAEELLKAIEAKDADAVGKAVAAMVQVCADKEED